MENYTTNQLLSEALRPKTFDDLVMRAPVKDRLKKMLETKDVMNMLFHGKPGSGKTTAAKIFTDSESFDSIVLDGSFDTGVGGIRDKVFSFSTTVSLFDHHKICFIDEADYLSKNSQAALRGLIEKMHENCRYIFTANSLAKIDPALRSRLLPICFDMTPDQAKSALADYIDRVIARMKSSTDQCNEERVRQIIQRNYPDFRTIANQLQFEMG